MFEFFKRLDRIFFKIFIWFLDLAKGLFRAVDQNQNGTLDFTDLMALSALLNKLYGQYGGGAAGVR